MSLMKLATLALAGLASAELPPIHIKGQKFFYKNGTQFFMKGIAYQEEATAKGGGVDTVKYVDPLSDEKKCKRDVPLLKELGVNTIRTYAINPKADHKACMKMLDDAGIYVISDLSEPSLSINRDTPSWTTEHLERYLAVVDELAPYSNVIGFFAGNEVSDADNNTEASAYVKAAVRDTKMHIKEKGYHGGALGVGYATNDHPEIRDDIADYFNCGKEDVRADFWGYNIYSWCGKSNMKDAGFDKWVEYYTDYPVPVFFAEYGCNSPGGAKGRTWEDTEALYSPAMTPVFSGGLVYMYHQEANDYGLVKITGGKAVKLANFDDLAEKHHEADPKAAQEDEYNPNAKSVKCPDTGKVWKANQVLPPQPDTALCKCAVAASGCQVKSNTSKKDYKKMFDYICENDKDSCAAISGDPEKGIYGAYSMCDIESQLTILLGLYGKNADSMSEACDFDGKAETKTGNAQSSCDDSLESAEAFNKKVATATGPMSNSPTGIDTGDQSAEGDDEDFGVMSAPIARLFSIGDMAVGLYMVVAVGVGATMVVL